MENIERLRRVLYAQEIYRTPSDTRKITLTGSQIERIINEYDRLKTAFEKVLEDHRDDIIMRTEAGLSPEKGEEG